MNGTDRSTSEVDTTLDDILLKGLSDEGTTLCLGILSDTHGRLPDHTFRALADCDQIIHAGDIGGPEILHSLEALAPVTAVLGNNDYDEYGAGVQRFAYPLIGGVRFLVAHYPRDVGSSSAIGRVLQPGDPLPQVCVHGHTHVPRIVTGKEARPADYVVCPGSVSYPRGGSKPSVAKVLIKGGYIEHIWIEELL